MRIDLILRGIVGFQRGQYLPLLDRNFGVVLCLISSKGDGEDVGTRVLQGEKTKSAVSEHAQGPSLVTVPQDLDYLSTGITQATRLRRGDLFEGAVRVVQGDPTLEPVACHFPQDLQPFSLDCASVANTSRGELL